MCCGSALQLPNRRSGSSTTATASRCALPQVSERSSTSMGATARDHTPSFSGWASNGWGGFLLSLRGFGGECLFRHLDLCSMFWLADWTDVFSGSESVPSPNPRWQKLVRHSIMSGTPCCLVEGSRPRQLPQPRPDGSPRKQRIEPISKGTGADYVVWPPRNGDGDRIAVIVRHVLGRKVD